MRACVCGGGGGSVYVCLRLSVCLCVCRGCWQGGGGIGKLGSQSRVEQSGAPAIWTSLLRPAVMSLMGLGMCGGAGERSWGGFCLTIVVGDKDLPAPHLNCK